MNNQQCVCVYCHTINCESIVTPASTASLL